jgi:hypothetical protein
VHILAVPCKRAPAVKNDYFSLANYNDWLKWWDLNCHSFFTVHSLQFASEDCWGEKTNICTFHAVDIERASNEGFQRKVGRFEGPPTQSLSMSSWEVHSRSERVPWESWFHKLQINVVMSLVSKNCKRQLIDLRYLFQKIPMYIVQTVL